MIWNCEFFVVRRSVFFPIYCSFEMWKKLITFFCSAYAFYLHDIWRRIFLCSRFFLWTDCVITFKFTQGNQLKCVHKNPIIFVACFLIVFFVLERSIILLSNWNLTKKYNWAGTKAHLPIAIYQTKKWLTIYAIFTFWTQIYFFFIVLSHFGCIKQWNLQKKINKWNSYLFFIFTLMCSTRA